MKIGQKVKRRDGIMCEVCFVHDGGFHAKDPTGVMWAYYKDGHFVGAEDCADYYRDIIDFNPSEYTIEELAKAYRPYVKPSEENKTLNDNFVNALPHHNMKTDERTTLTRRERFAMAAMQGLLAEGDVDSDEDIVKDAVIIADKLIAALDEEKK